MPQIIHKKSLQTSQTKMNAIICHRWYTNSHCKPVKLNECNHMPQIIHKQSLQTSQTKMNAIICHRSYTNSHCKPVQIVVLFNRLICLGQHMLLPLAMKNLHHSLQPNYLLWKIQLRWSIINLLCIQSIESN